MFKKITKKISSSESTNISKFSFLQFFFWSTWALYGGYAVYYLTDIGYSNMEIGTVMSVRTFTGIIGPPVIGYICDRLQTRKTIFILGMIILGLLVVPFPLYNKFYILFFTAIIGFIWAPQQSILDSWILETSPELADNYGFMRAWGSIGFAIFVTIYGVVIKNWGWSIHFMSYGIFVILTIIFALVINDNSYKNKTVFKNTPDKAINTNPLQLFKNPSYVFILIVTVLIFIPFTIIFTYLAPILRSIGGNSQHLGITLFFNALSEAPIFFTAKYILRKFKVKPLLLIASIFYLIRIIIAALATSPYYFIFFGLLQSLSYGIYLISIRYYVNIIAPDGLKTTAQSIVLMFGFGIGGIIANLLGGYLLDNYSLAFMFQVCIFIISLAIILLLISLITEKIKQKNNI